jgi:hypothetical protein
MRARDLSNQKNAYYILNTDLTQLKNALEQIVYLLVARILSGINMEAEGILCSPEALPFIHLFSQSSSNMELKTPA